MLHPIPRFIDDHRSAIHTVLWLGLVTTWFSSYVEGLTQSTSPTMQLQAPDQEVWRMTSDGWELAHALQSTSQDGTVMHFPIRTDAIRSVSFWVSVHRCLLPVAIASLFGTLMPWLLLKLPNQAIPEIQGNR